MQMNVHSVLGERPPRMPVAGKIRTGIKVLTSAARQNKDVVRLYESGIRQGLSFDKIEASIFALSGNYKVPLVPRNTPYFKVHRHDWTMPELADRMLDLYGEDRGEGRQLYRFPIILPFDRWLDVMPHGLKSYAASGLKYWSEYDAAGSRFCWTHAQAGVSQAARRASRAWGGRTHVLREENGGVCDPNGCKEYQCGACKLTARLLFHVPGIPGSSLIELGTSSVYSMQQLRGQMELVASIRAGRISGVHDGQPIFYVAKTEEEVVKLEDGKPKRVRQYLVKLEATIDMTAVYARQEQQMALPNAERAVAALTGTPTPATDIIDAVATPVQNAAPAPEEVAPTPADDASPLQAARRKVYAMIRSCARPEKDLLAELQETLGDGWGDDTHRLRQAEAHLAMEA